MRSAPLISIVVPVYNVEKYINKCLDSILNQTFKEFEVILIDDGSKDSSGAICDEYAQLDVRVRVVHKENGGLVSAWMRGLEEALADYIVFVDSDDWVECRMLELMWDEKERNRPDVVVVNLSKVYGDKKYRKHTHFASGFYDESQLLSEIYPGMLNTGEFQLRGIPVSRWGKLIKKKMIQDNVKYSDKKVSYSEDLNIMMPVLMDCHSVSILDDERADYYYRMNPQSILHTYNKTMYSQILLVYKQLFQSCEDKGKLEVFETQLYADYLAAMVQCYKNELMSKDSFSNIKKQIDEMARDERLKKAIRVVNWRHYRKLNVLIIFCMGHWNWFAKNVITYILYSLKKYKVKKLEKELHYT